MRGIIDMHCDTISALYDKEKARELVSLRENTGHVDLCRMKSSGYILQNFALFVEKEKNRNPWERFWNWRNLQGATKAEPGHDCPGILLWRYCCQ